MAPSRHERPLEKTSSNDSQLSSQMTVHWLNAYYAVVDGTCEGSDRHCYKVVTLDGRNTGRYGFSLEKAQEIAKKLTANSINDALSPSCTECHNKTEWKHWHVYVIELNPRVMRERRGKILRTNPDVDIDAPCFYVGSTRHKCACRYQQHRLDHRGQKGYRCQCYGGEPIVRYFRRGERKKGTRGSYAAGRYGVRLRPDLYAHKNPIHSEVCARTEEKKLAERLREHGAAVIQA